ncbi:MAG: S8 family serine peptidase [Phycisphaerales bacterium]|nr:S8 family serine peptidase [Phycisphaerales bacterium]
MKHARIIALAALALAHAALAGPQPKIHPALTRMLAEHGTAKAWVFLTDKGLRTPAGHAAAIAALESTYDARAVSRRRARRTDPGLFDDRDLPLASGYVEGVRATGARVRRQSRWVNAVSVELTPEQARRLAALPFVRALQPIRTGPGPDSTRHALPPHAEDFYGYASEQLTQMNLVAVHDQGFTGQGVVVGILDTGFVRTHEAFHEPGHELGIVAEWDFVKDDPNTAPEPGDNPDQHVHGTLILGTQAGYRPGTYVGGAYDATFILCKTEDLDSETPVEEDNYVAGLEFIESHGGDMATASLIYIDWYTQADLNGLTAVTTIGVNTATANGVYCVNAAGNAGHDENPATSALGAPADAFRVLTIGAVAGDGAIAGFSSDGPTADGRTKPELLARGVDTATVNPGDDHGYTGASGTSLSTPLVAGCVASLIQARPTWTVDQMRTMLFATAGDQVAAGHPDPLFVRGYGLINAGLALSSDCNANGTPDALDISGGASRDCNGNGRPDECECRPDFNGDGVLDLADFGAFQTGFALANPCADFNNDGALNLADFGAFQTGFALGCN